MHRQRSRLAPERRPKDRVFETGSKFKVPGFTSSSQTRNGERKVDGTTDQYYRFVLPLMDALRFDRDRGGSAGTMAVCPDGA